MSIFRDNYRLEVERRYKEAGQDRLNAVLAMNEATPSIFTKGALGRIFGGGVRQSIAEFKEEVLEALSPLHIPTMGALAAVHRDVSSNARRSHSEADVNEELAEIWDDFCDEVRNLTPQNISEFLKPDENLARLRETRDAGAYDGSGEVNAYTDDAGRSSRFMPQGRGR